MGKTKVADGKPRLNYPKTILTGFGFMSTMIAWAIYDPYVTKILNRLLTDSPLVAQWSERIGNIPLLEPFMAINTAEGANLSGAFTLVPLFIGIIMTFDNIFGVVFQPLFGRLSDGCHSRFGKRRPFIMIGAPISALLFALIPLMGTLSLPALMVCVILFVFVMSLWRSPVVALMPDLTPPELHSSGNAVINLVGSGLGTVLGMGAGMLVTTVYMAMKGIPKGGLEDEFVTFPYVFLFGSVIMIICTLVVTFCVKEKDSRLLSTDVLASRDYKERKAAEKKAKAEEKVARKAITLSRGEKISLGFMLACLFFQFAATNSVQTFFALFADEILHRDVHSATSLTITLALSAGAAALPSGWLGRKLGRKKTILLGMGLFMAAFGIFFAALVATTRAHGTGINGYVIANRSLLDAAKAAGMSIGSFMSQNPLLPGVSVVTAVLDMINTLIFPVLALAGFGTMMVTVNTLPLVLEIGGVERIGTFTGYYYTATFSAQIVAPITFGFFRMFSGSYISLFYFCPIMLVLSLLMILFVRHGEAVPQELIDQAEQAA